MDTHADVLQSVLPMSPNVTIPPSFQLALAQRAWDLVVCQHNPLASVSARLGVPQPEMQKMLLLLAMPWDEKQIN